MLRDHLRPCTALLGLAVLIPLAACSGAPMPVSPSPAYALTQQEALPYGEQNYAYRWIDIMQEASARDVERFEARPTVLSRQMMIWAVAMFDAWSAYDDKAVSTRTHNRYRRPTAEHTIANKRAAISFASYRALLGVLPAHADYLREEMLHLGYDPDDTSTDATTPQGIGNLAAAAVLDYRRHDGANQFGDHAGSNGMPYSDWTGYQPINTADHVIDPDRWQPITFTKPDGTKFTPGCLTPHWGRIVPFALDAPDQFRAEPLPTTKSNDKLLREQTDLVLHYNQNLTGEEKALVEFMRDGPRSTGQSGHWLRFAQDVSRRNHNDLDTDVKLFFAVACAAFDAFIACWDTKMFYDSSRPWTLVRHYYQGQMVKGWAGPNGGVVSMPAEKWHPYSPYAFITPPFPGYTSGHATVSGTCAKILELFTGSDEYGGVEVRPCCELTEQSSPETARIDLPTFSATSTLAAKSRALGGYHIPIDNDVGLRLGRELATWAWPKYRAYWEGTGTVRQ